VLILENAKNLNVEDIESEKDIYVVDRSFIWTYG